VRQARYWIFGLLALHAAAAIELAMGRTPICRCGTIRLWQNEVLSPENSQQITDWYTLSHIVHGLIFYATLAWAAPRLALGARALIALLIEIVWEITENTSWVIDRYREATIALDYYGDSVLNSVSDMLAMLLGFWLASRLPAWASVLLALGLEALALAVIRDNLTLNVLMLLYPLQSIRHWQAGQ
jgi:hypothetical protein